MTTVEREEQEIQEEMERRKKADVLRQIELENQQKEEQARMWREKKKDKTKSKVNLKLKEYNDKKDTPTFVG